MKKAAPKGHTAKHKPAAKKHTTAAKKHTPGHAPKQPTATLGWEPHVVALPPAHHKPRKLALGTAVACCSAEALAASLRLTGRPVGDADVLALYELTADDLDAGASIWSTLEAAARHGLAGARPVAFEPVWALADGVVVGGELPGGPHAMTFEGGAWWSWGERDPQPPLLAGFIPEEAWAVTWA